MYKNDASRPPTEEEWAVASGISLVQLRRTLEEGKEAQSILVSANIHLVASIAKKHYFALKRSNDATNGMGGLALQDFIQEGNLGLLAAAERFDPSRGFRFSTYAHYWIRQRILKSISDSSRVIRLPESGTF
jgi:RNA polymerase sigma factor (sigma-70 family)